jgi:hypothetical protein
MQGTARKTLVSRKSDTDVAEDEATGKAIHSSSAGVSQIRISSRARQNPLPCTIVVFR